MSALSDLAQREAARALRALDEGSYAAFVAWSHDTDPWTERTPPEDPPSNERRAAASLGALDHPEVLQGIAESQRAHRLDGYAETSEGEYDLCVCGWQGPNHERHQAEAVVAALTGRAS